MLNLFDSKNKRENSQNDEICLQFYFGIFYSMEAFCNLSVFLVFPDSGSDVSMMCCIWPRF
jgi:hypothetical protein